MLHSSHRHPFFPRHPAGHLLPVFDTGLHELPQPGKYMGDMEGEPHAGPPASVVVRLGTTTTTSGSPAVIVVVFFLFGFPPELQVQRAATTTQLRPPTPNPLILRSLVFYLVTRLSHIHIR